MRNQPHSQWQVIDAVADRRESSWNLDRQVELRTWLLGVLLATGLVGVLYRLTDLKANHQGDYLANANPITKRSEPIAAVDGRIYSSDGVLLAYDHQQFDIAVHYRWLESPPDARWLKSRLSYVREHFPAGTKALDDAAVTEMILQDRLDLWSRLARAGGLTAEEFEERRVEIQEQVEKIANVVNEKRRERLSKETDEQPFELPQSWTAWAEWWEVVKRELTEPPRREHRERIVIREELDFHAIIEDVPTEVVAEIESRPSHYPGVQIRTSTNRIYPEGALASHVIGLRRSLRNDQARERREEFDDDDPLAFRSGDRYGQFGVERSYNTTLRGFPGEKRLEFERTGTIRKEKIVRESRTGDHLVLSISSQLQSKAEQLLDELIPPEVSLVPPLPQGADDPDPEPQGGAVIVMNVYSGELLAAASAPRPDLTALVANSTDYWSAMQADERAPLLSRLTQVALPPGSSFKPVAAAALCEEEGVPATSIVCEGFLEDPFNHRCAIFRSHGIGHGEVSLASALSRSCNVYFFQAARRLGPDPLVNWSRRFGFGQATGIDLPFEKRGHIPAPHDNEMKGRYRWYPGDALGLAIGQSYLTVTPLQMLVMTAAIANGGERVVPRVVSRITKTTADADQKTIVPEVESKPLALADETLAAIQDGMRRTVMHPEGTGRRSVYLKEVAIAGKTGTAQTGLNDASHAWFVGYVPADQPRFAFVVMLEHGGSGGDKAGAVAKAVVSELLNLGFVQPDG